MEPAGQARESAMRPRVAWNIDPGMNFVFKVHFTISQQQEKERKAKGGATPACGGFMTERQNVSRSKAIAALIRRIIIRREADMNWLSNYVPNFRRRLYHYESGDRNISLDAFLDLMTALRCEVVVIPVGRWAEWYRLNDFPDNNGNVLQMPQEIKRGRKKRRE